MTQSLPINLSHHLGTCRRSPDAALDARYRAIYGAATELVLVLLGNTQAGRDQIYAVQSVRAALACAEAAATGAD